MALKRALPALLLLAPFAQAQAAKAKSGSPVEEIYIIRSARVSRIEPTEFCAQRNSGFAGATMEDQYTFRSTATQPDGRLTSANVKTVGSIHACFGPKEDPLVLNFFGVIQLGALQFRGSGDCRLKKPDFPEPGITIINCYLDLTGLPEPYVGGLLTTNSIASLKPLGLESDPPGYVQPSIATVRLWKKRPHN